MEAYKIENLPFHTREEYLELEDRAETKSEYHKGYIIAMAGTTLAHNRININLIIEIGSFLRGSKCEIFSNDLKLEIEAAESFFYPDAMIVCGEPKLVEGRKDILEDATVVIEILSPTTSSFDSNEKFSAYRALPSFKEYILIEQDIPYIKTYYKKNESEWLLQFAEGLNDTLKVISVGAEIPLSAIYQSVEFQRSFPKKIKANNS